MSTMPHRAGLLEPLLATSPLHLLQEPDLLQVTRCADRPLDANAVGETDDVHLQPVDLELDCAGDQLVVTASARRLKPDIEPAVTRDQRQAGVRPEASGVPALHRLESDVLESQRRPACFDLVQHVRQPLEIRPARGGADVEVLRDAWRPKHPFRNAAEDDETDGVAYERFEQWPGAKRRASAVFAHSA